MDYSLLGNSPLQVSKICLGTMTFGEQNTEEEAFEQLDYALEQGINFIDTAEIYPVPPIAETQGLTETYIGNWFKKRHNRDKVVLASKVSGPGDWMHYLRGGPKLNREHLQQALDNSLQRLRTDYIDLYQVHWPSRKTNFFGKLGYETAPDEEDVTPIVETLSVLAEFVQAGKVRYLGISNETPWGAMTYLRLAEQLNYPRIVSIQNPYNLLNRSFEVGLAEIAHREKIGLLAYSPLAFGVLTGKYLNGAHPIGARLTLFERFSRYNNAEGQRCAEAYVKLAREHGLSPAQMALAYINSRPFLTSNIIGATDLDQLNENIESIHLKLSPEVLEAIETIHSAQPNPCP